MFCRFRAKERAGYATVLHCGTKQKYRQQANEVAALTNQTFFRLLGLTFQETSS